MMGRDQIQQRIADLDKKINEELATTKLPDSSRRKNFPIGTLLVAALCFAWAWYGQLIPQPNVASAHAATAEYAPYAGMVFIGLAILQAFFWIIQPKAMVGEKYQETTARVREMQEDRRRMMADLKAMDE